jgi:butyryl-CoA dehydrogenase
LKKEKKHMDFILDKKHEMARQLFAEFAEKEVKPLAQETDELEQFPEETVKKMQKLGFMGIPIPKEYGGQGCDTLTYVLCVEELSKVCGTTGVIVSAHTSLCCDPILTYGTEEQKQKYLVPLAKGEKLGAFALTEPGAGTDAQGAQTKAVEDGDSWVLNGSKCFITNGKYADIYIVFAVTDVLEDAKGRKNKRFSAFIVEKGTPGFSF